MALRPAGEASLCAPRGIPRRPKAGYTAVAASLASSAASCPRRLATSAALAGAAPSGAPGRGQGRGGVGGEGERTQIGEPAGEKTKARVLARETLN